MSSCSEDLYDYELVKKCSKCAFICLKSNSHKNESMCDGLYKQCKSCRKQKIMEI